MFRHIIVKLIKIFEIKDFHQAKMIHMCVAADG